MLTLFPGERPEYVSEGEMTGFCAEVTLKEDNGRISVFTVIKRDGQTGEGHADAVSTGLRDIAYTSLCQKLVRLSFYRAAVPAFASHPPWGALTGIRPGKILSDMLAAGMGRNEAVASMTQNYYVSPKRAEMALSTALASHKARNSLFPGDIALYVGIPFCPTRCAYCSFVSNSVEKSSHMVEPYLETLYGEIIQTAEIVSNLGLRVISIYIGGGTPTTLSSRQLGGLLDALAENFDLSALREYTMEAGRPDTISHEKLKVLETSGVTRISINPQSMEDHVLRAIGRNHTATDTLNALDMAKRYKFDINADLIAGLPGDTAEGFARSLDTVMEYSAENITVHCLALKKGSKIMTENTSVPNSQVVGDMLNYAGDALRSGGYSPYYLYRQKYMSGGFENVGYSLPNRENIYNICIMEELCSIISMGAGGSTKLVEPHTGRIERMFNPKYPYEYINRTTGKSLEFYKQIDFFNHLGG